MGQRSADVGGGTMIAAAEIERAGAVRLEDEIARRSLQLKRVGAELVGPCPVCGGRDRFAIHTTKQLWNCRNCGVGGDIIDFVRHHDGCGFASAITTLNGDSARGPKPAVRPLHRDENKDERHNLDRAEAIWRETSPLGPDAIAYFAKRKININVVPEIGSLRFHPRCPWGNGTTPAIIGRFTTVLGNEPRGIWRRPISGEKPMTLGPIATCVIRLWPD
jgi:hypothetical protein